MSAKRFRIAFSFAGEKRDFVAQVAGILAKRFGKTAILYDKFHEAEFARARLGRYLPKLYHEESDLVVVVICGDYANKEWPGLEWDAIFDLLKKRREDDVMLGSFDHATVEGLYSDAGFIDLDLKTPEQAADLILERLALNEDKARRVDSAPIATAQPEPNIVLRWDDNDNYFGIAIDPKQRRTFRESPSVKRCNAVLVQFRNAPKPPHKLGKAINVTAEVLYYEDDNPEVIDLSTAGCWLNTPSPTVSFDLNSSQYLILGYCHKVDGGYQFEVYDSGETDEGFCAMFGSFSPCYKIVVSLSWGEHREFGIEESFELITEFGERGDFFELLHLTGEVDDDGRPIKRTRGRVYLR